MECTRCQGLMVSDRHIDPETLTWVTLSCCMNCGNLVDPLIAYNRTLHQPRRLLDGQPLDTETTRETQVFEQAVMESTPEESPGSSS